MQPGQNAIPKETLERYRRTSGLSESAAASYAHVVRLFGEHLDSRGLSLEDVDRDTVVAFADAVDKHRGRPSKRNLSTSVRHFFRWLESEGVLPDADGRVGAKGSHGRYSQRLRKSPRERVLEREGRDAPRKKPPGRPRNRNGSIDERLIDAFLEERAAAGKNTGEPAYAVRAFSRYIEDAGVPFEEVSPETLEAFGSWVKTAYAESSWRNIFTYVRAFYSWLEEKGYYENVAKGFAVKGGRLARRERAPLSLEDARKVLAAAGDNDNLEIALRDRMVVGMMVVSALWPGEMHSANVGDVAFVGNFGVISIRATSKKPASVVYLPPRVAADARRYIEYRQAGPDDPLVASAAPFNAGERVHANTVSMVLERAFAHAGIEGKPGKYSLQQTALELAMEGGYAAALLKSLARTNCFATLYRLDCTRLLADATPQSKVAALLDDVDGDARHAVVNAGMLRSMLEGMADDDPVDLSIDRSGTLSVRRIKTGGASFRDRPSPSSHC